jgi:hypothetical protein
MTDEEPFLTRWSRRKRGAADSHAQAPPEQAKRPLAPENEPEHASGEPAALDSVPPDERAGVAPAQPLVDLSQLPPLESITAETDIRAFLAPGVPVELARAALRRAWSADASIRDFIGLVENDWDVLAPAAAAGVQPLTITDEMRRMVEALFSPGETAPSEAAAEGRGEACLAPTTAVPADTPAAEQATQSLVSPAETGAHAEAATSAVERADVDESSVTSASSGVVDAACSVAQPTATATHQIDVASQNRREESQPVRVMGRRGHGRALPI